MKLKVSNDCLKVSFITCSTGVGGDCLEDLCCSHFLEQGVVLTSGQVSFTSVHFSVWNILQKVTGKLLKAVTLVQPLSGPQ